MHARSTAWSERERRRWLRPDFERWLKPDWRDRKYWVTPPPECAQHPDDAHFPPSVTTQAVTAGADSPDSMRGEIAEIERNIQLLRRELASIQYELLQRKAGFKEDQPRWPKDSPGSLGGRWSGDGPAKPGIGHNQGPPLEDPPEIPKQRPSTGKERNNIVKALARWAVRAGRVLTPAGIATIVAEVVADSWLTDLDRTRVEAYRDEPKTMEELQRAATTYRPGYDIHHVAEWASAWVAGFPRSQINDPSNLVSIPTLKHWEINRWYETPTDAYGGKSPREYLRNPNIGWEERTRIGREALIKSGVLKP